MYSAGKNRQKFLEPLVPLPTQGEFQRSQGKGSGSLRRSLRLEKSRSTSSNEGPSPTGEPRDVSSPASNSNSNVSSARLVRNKSVELNSSNSSEPPASPGIQRESPILSRSDRSRRSLRSTQSSSFDQSEASGLDQSETSSDGPRRNASADRLFGKVSRSSSASRQTELITPTLNVTGEKEVENEGDLLLESFTSAQFRVEKDSKDRRKRPGTTQPKVGPCKCKGCTVKREEEQKRLSKTAPAVVVTPKPETKRLSASQEIRSSPKIKSKEPPPSSGIAHPRSRSVSKPIKANSIDKPEVIPKKTHARSRSLKGRHSDGSRNHSRSPSPSKTVRRNSASVTEEKSGEKKKSKKKKRSKSSRKEKDKKESKKTDGEKTKDKKQNKNEMQILELEPDDSGYAGSIIHGEPEDWSKLEAEDEVMGQKENLESSLEEFNFQEIVSARKVSQASGNSLDVAHPTGPERSATETTCCSSFLFEEMQDSLRGEPTLTPRMLEFMDGDSGAPDEQILTVVNTDMPLDRETISSRMGSRNDNTGGAVIKWKRGPMLGRGAFGTVWCGLTMTGEMVAVKQSEIPVGDLDRAQKEYEKLQGEVELLKSLRHRNIVGYLGTSLDGRTVSIFMQYIPGGSVYSILKKFGPLAEEVVARYTGQILDGLCYLHSKNVIHRDIKGSNVMLMPTGVIKLIDFGCAKRALSLNKSNSDILLSMKGTPFWMSPEVVNGTGHGTKSDVWSVGCTFYEMATAKPPWSHMNKYQALCAIGTGVGHPKIGEKFSAEAQDFLALCLTRESEKRPTACALLSHPFLVRHHAAPSQSIHDSKGLPRNSSGRRKLV